MGLALLQIAPVTQSDVEVAWATYRALILTEVDDPALQEDETHQLAISTAKLRFERMFDAWSNR